MQGQLGSIRQVLRHLITIGHDQGCRLSPYRLLSIVWDAFYGLWHSDQLAPASLTCVMQHWCACNSSGDSETPVACDVQ